MARTTRNIQPGSPNHIVTCGNNRRRLFSYPRDYLAFLGLLLHALRGTECLLHAACLMANHIHLLVTPPSVRAASECMKRCSQRYAQIRNDKLEASGKLFEQRFFSKPIVDERQLALTTMYIEANPVRAGLMDGALGYRWSTHSLHLAIPASATTNAFAGLWTASDWYQQLGSSSAARAEAYRELFSAYLGSDTTPDHAHLLADIEELSASAYGHRLRRPDGTRASEPAAPGYGRRG